MAPPGPGDRIVVRGLRLWAHVGVLEFEREQGQWFELDLELGVDLKPAGRSDLLADTLDYAQLITALQHQARAIRCHTLEHYSEQILTLIAERCGPLPLQLELRKCAAPVPGFNGMVAVRRSC
jgi:7,8-dihydroneopterin aldolase/epimerase/oxygenase